MKRSTPLRRSKGVRRRRPEPRRSSRVRDGEYMAWVRTRRCAAWWLYFSMGEACEGPVEAHHMGARGLGQKADDATCVPLCRLHHRSWHDASGQFKGWTRNTRETFAAMAIEETQRLYEQEAEGISYGL